MNTAPHTRGPGPQTLDTEGKGYIEANVMKELLRHPETTPFHEKELDGQRNTQRRSLASQAHKHPSSLPPYSLCVCVPAFMSAAKDLETGNIFYEDYIAELCANQ